MTDDKRDARAAIEDLELDKHLARAGAAATKFAQEAVGFVGAFADEHRDQGHGLLDRAESEVDRVTGGRASDLVRKVRSGLAAGLDVVADQRPGSDERPDSDEPPAGPPSSGE